MASTRCVLQTHLKSSSQQTIPAEQCLLISLQKIAVFEETPDYGINIKEEESRRKSLTLG